MRRAILTFLVLLSPIIFANTIVKYNVDPGVLHTGGSAIVENLKHDSKFLVNIKYQLKKKIYVPIEDEKLKGETDYELPMEYQTERGYQELEALKKIEIDDAFLYFTKRADYKNLKNAYFFQVHPKNGKSKVHVVYHPNLPGVGWAQIDIFIIIKKLGIDHYQVTLKSL